jgi:hypothetical protein
LEWIPSGRAPQPPLELRRLGDFQQPGFDSLYKSEALQWQPRGKPEPLPPETRRLGDFQQPAFDALYKPAGIQWVPSDRYAGQLLPYALTRYWVIDPIPPVNPALLNWQPQERYFGRALARSANDYSVYTLLLIAAAYDPRTLEWLARSVYPQVPVERRLLGDFQQPAFDALYKSEGLQWFQGERYFGRSLARALNDWSVLVQLVTAAAYDPKNIEWQARDSYSGRQLARALVDWSVYQGDSIPALPPIIIATPSGTIGGIGRWTIQLPREPAKREQIRFRRNMENADRQDLEDIAKILKALEGRDESG